MVTAQILNLQTPRLAPISAPSIFLICVSQLNTTKSWLKEKLLVIENVAIGMGKISKILSDDDKGKKNKEIKEI